MTLLNLSAYRGAMVYPPLSSMKHSRKASVIEKLILKLAYKPDVILINHQQPRAPTTAHTHTHGGRVDSARRNNLIGQLECGLAMPINLGSNVQLVKYTSLLDSLVAFVTSTIFVVLLISRVQQYIKQMFKCLLAQFILTYYQFKCLYAWVLSTN